MDSFLLFTIVAVGLALGIAVCIGYTIIGQRRTSVSDETATRTLREFLDSQDLAEAAAHPDRPESLAALQKLDRLLTEIPLERFTVEFSTRTAAILDEVEGNKRAVASAPNEESNLPKAVENLPPNVKGWIEIGRALTAEKFDLTSQFNDATVLSSLTRPQQLPGIFRLANASGEIFETTPTELNSQQTREWLRKVTGADTGAEQSIAQGHPKKSSKVRVVKVWSGTDRNSSPLVATLTIDSQTGKVTVVRVNDANPEIPQNILGWLGKSAPADSSSG